MCKVCEESYKILLKDIKEALKNEEMSFIWQKIKSLPYIKLAPPQNSRCPKDLNRINKTV